MIYFLDLALDLVFSDFDFEVLDLALPPVMGGVILFMITGGTLLVAANMEVSIPAEKGELTLARWEKSPMARGLFASVMRPDTL